METSLTRLSNTKETWTDGLEQLWETPAWFALYTRSRHEQVVKSQLDGKGIENFLPLYTKQSIWKDRRKQLELPLFPGYLFVRIPLIEKTEVLKSFGVVHLVGDGRRPLPIPEDQVSSLKTCVENGLKYDPCPYLKVGQRVRIKDGPFAEMEGILVRKKNVSRLVISIDLIHWRTRTRAMAWAKPGTTA